MSAPAAQRAKADISSPAWVVQDAPGRTITVSSASGSFGPELDVAVICCLPAPDVEAGTVADALIQTYDLDSSAVLKFVEHRDCMGMPDPNKNVFKTL